MLPEFNAFNVLFSCLLGMIGLLIFTCLTRKKKARQKSEYKWIEPRKPGNGTSLFHG